MKQQYSPEDDLHHIKWLIEVFKDPRYIKINERPLLLIYRVSDLPDHKTTASLWREEVKRSGFTDLYLCSVESFSNEHSNPINFGFDASVEFQPDWSKLGSKDARHPELNVFDYGDIVDRMINKPEPQYVRFPCVTPSWDNSPRKGRDGYIFHNSRTEHYEKWLRHALAIANKNSLEENFVFINFYKENIIFAI